MRYFSFVMRLRTEAFPLAVTLRFICTICAGLAATPTARAAMGNITALSVSNDTVWIASGVDVLALRVWRTNMVEMDFRPNGVWQPVTDIIGDTNSRPTAFSIDTNGNPIVIATDALRVEIDRAPCRFRVYDGTGTNLLLREQSAEGVFADGLRLHTPPGADHYGIHAFTPWEDTSSRILRNSGGFVEAGYQGDAGAPLVWSRQGYGLLVDSDGGQFTISGTNLTFQYVSKTNVLFYLAAGEPAELLAAFYDVSGRPPMLPKWSMGFANTEWGITQGELTNIVSTYRQKQIPIDHYILDFDWKAWGENNYGEWRWNTTKFPDGASGALKSAMDAAGIHLSGIMKPRIHVNTAQGGHATSNNYWWPGQSTYNDYFSGQPVKDVNFALPACRQWYFDHITNAYQTGIIGWWNDEADQAGGGGILFGNWQFLNMQKALYEGQRGITSQRVWSINRNFYLGSQRYAYAMWSGDIDGGFAAMVRERERMLASINLGAVKWGMDIGGFNNGGWTTAECYARWMQFGAVVPVYRVHGQENNQRQPWVYGATAEAAAKAAIRFRYQLIPYIYSYERAAYETGHGLVRPLVFHFPADSAVANRVEEWMVGEHLLAAPVLTAGASSQSIYLPAGGWRDYFRGTAYTGPQTINYSVNSSTWTDLPLFVRSGAILPMQPVMNHVGELPLTNLIVEVFPDWTPSSFTYYDDDGETYAYETGVWFKQVFTTAQEDGRTVFDIAAPTGAHAPALAHLECRIHAPTGTEVHANGALLPAFESLAAFSNSIDEGWFATTNRFGPVTHVRVAAQAARFITITNNVLAPPAFTPAGGTFTGPTLLSVQSPTTDAVLRITSDGADPSESSPVYTGPFLVWSTATFKARAFLEGRSPSTVASATIAIDFNQLLNPGFEQQGSTTNHPLYWHSGEPDIHGSRWGSASRVAWRSHEGTWQCTIKGTWAGQGNEGGMWQERPVLPGRTYEFSAWFWSDSTWSATRQGMKLEFLTGQPGGTNYLQATTSTFSNVGQTWTLKSMSATAPENAEWVRVVIFAEGAGANGALQFDDLRLVPGGALPFTVASAHGAPQPAIGTHLYNLGTVITATVDAVIAENGTQFVCTGWTLSGHEPGAGTGAVATITLTNACLLTWQWSTNLLEPATFNFATTAVAVAEGDPYAVLQVLRSGGTSGVAQVQFRSLDGSASSNHDYSGTSGVLTFGDGITEQSISVPILDDVLFEGDETFAVELHAPSGGGLLGAETNAVVTILDDDPDLGGVSLAVVSEYGQAEPAVGLHTYPYGTPLTARLTNTVENGTTQYVGAGWIGSGSIPETGSGSETPLVTLTNDSSVEWLWSTNVWLAPGTVGNGTINGLDAGWYPLGTSVTVWAAALTNHSFSHWTGDVSGVESTQNPLLFEVDHARSFAAVFRSLVGSNLLNNPSFEIQGATADIASHWMLNDPDAHGSASGTALRVNWRASDGAWSAAIRGTWSGAGTRGDWWQEIPISGTERYRFSAWFWADDGNPYGPWTAAQQFMALDFLARDGGNETVLLSVTQLLAGITQTWQQRSVEAHAPTGANWARVRVTATGVGSDGALQLDEVNLHTLEVLPAPEWNPATGVGATSFVANWQPVPGAVAYRFELATNADFQPAARASDLFISEYGEGSGSSNRYIELFNGTGTNINLAQYRLWMISGGGNWPEFVLDLSGNLPDGTTFVIRASSSTHTTVVSRANLSSASTVMSFSGDDAIGLARNNGTAYTLIDAVGQSGADPGTGWGVGGIADATFNRTLLRAPSVMSPNPDWTTGSNEWVVLPVNTFTNVGEHAASWRRGSDFVPGYDPLSTGPIDTLAVTGLAPGATFYARLQAVGGNGESPYSEILVTTTRATYSISALSGSSGQVAPAGIVQIAAGSNAVFAITADAFHYIAALSTNSTAVLLPGATNSLEFVWSNVWADGTLQAEFAPLLAVHETPHWWLHEHFGATNYDDAAESDEDSDGVPAWQEYRADTDPTNAASFLRLWLETETGEPLLRFLSSTARSYRIEFLSDPAADTWQPEGDAPLPGDGQVLSRPFTNDAGQRLFRLRALMP